VTETLQKCDTPVILPGGLSAGCTVMVPASGADHDHKYEPPSERFEEKIVLCPVCSSACGDTSEGTFADPEGVEVYQCDNCDTNFALAEAFKPEVELPEPEDEFTGAMVLCPTDQHQIDATKWGTQTHVCPEDGVVFTVDVRPEAVAQYAMY
jgi:hypothetical protein